MRNLDRCKRVLYLNKLCFRPFIIILQTLLLLVIRHQNDATFHNLYRNLLSGIKTRRAQPLAGKDVECESAIINSLIVGEVRRSGCVPAHRGVEIQEV